MNDRKIIYLDDAIDAIVGRTNCGTEDELRAYAARHSLENLWTGGIVDALDAIKRLPSAQPEIIHCRDCKHRPKATRADEKVFYGFSVEFPDEKCPCQCGDGWYNWYPEDDFYCGYAERAEDG